MKLRLWGLFAIVAILGAATALLTGGLFSTVAQTPPPSALSQQQASPPAPDWAGSPLPFEDFLDQPIDGPPYEVGDEDTAQSAVLGPLAIGAPDQYGYTWDDSASLSWIDATVGTDTGMGGSGNQQIGPVNLPFSFRFYENSYSQIYIASAGYAAFTNEGVWRSQGHVPSVIKPNNVLAPYWVPTYLNSTGPTGRVYYGSGGSAPNRFFVVEWHDVKGGPSSDTTGGDDTYRFELVLHENGDIVFQYQTISITGGYYCATVGIEDAAGMDGQEYNGSYCAPVASGRVVRFQPNQSARVKLTTREQGRFSHAGATESFNLMIRNTGDLGSDVYDLTSFSTWSSALYRADGVTPLVDTDGDALVDTGSVAQGASVTVTMKISTPAWASVGNSAVAYVTARSSLNSSKSSMATMRSAIPAPFAQLYQDSADGALSLYVTYPQEQSVQKVTADDYWGVDAAIAQTAASDFAYIWSKDRCLPPCTGTTVDVAELEYTVRSPHGGVVRSTSKLTDNSSAAMTTYDFLPSVAVAPNGRIGALWSRYVRNGNNTTSPVNYNIYFAILDASGGIAYGPVNLTNNVAWGLTTDPNVPGFYTPQLTATDDNRFLLAWVRENVESAGWVDDIYYAARDTLGNEVLPITRLTSDTAGSDDSYLVPALAPLAGGRALLTYARSGNYGDIYYGVLDSGGNVVRAMTNLTNDGANTWDWRPDAVQLSNGKTLVAWPSGSSPAYGIRYAMLNASYGVASGFAMLANPAPMMASGFAYVSLAADAAGHGIITWTDYPSSGRRNLYYTLLDSNGAVLTTPMIFRTSQAASPYIMTSLYGNGNTSNGSQPFLNRLDLPSVQRNAP